MALHIKVAPHIKSLDFRFLKKKKKKKKMEKVRIW